MASEFRPAMVPTEPSVGPAAVRRLVDVVGSLAALVVLSPLMLAIAAAVRMSSPGPVFYRQQRVGHGGRLFWILKFRTMRAADGPLVTSSGDHRITSVGRRLRQTKLDELPQFVNVLRGDMSLVGPRPEVPAYVRYYTAEQVRILSVRPGITGVTQLSFGDEERLLSRAQNVEAEYISKIMPAKLESDLAYLENRSVRSDLRLLIQTGLHVIGTASRRSAVRE